MENDLELEQRNEYSSTIFIFIVLTLILVMRIFMFGLVEVDGKSMMPNIQDGNILFTSKLSDVDRFDEVVFDAPYSDELYIKRVIGLPGDTIKMKDNVLYVNGESYQEPYTDKDTYNFSLKELTGEAEVPENKLFVLGDNRPNSSDSRAFGFLSKDSVKGESIFRIWPFDKIGTLD